MVELVPLACAYCGHKLICRFDDKGFTLGAKHYLGSDSFVAFRAFKNSNTIFFSISINLHPSIKIVNHGDMYYNQF